MDPRPVQPAPWTLRVILVAVSVAFLNCSAVSGTSHARGEASEVDPTRMTFVSLTFDDGAASQYAARSILASHDMNATFFVSSELVGNGRYYMTWEQLHDLAADGNEIGGHTRDHVNLTTVDEAEQRRQVCEDRLSLQARGFAVKNFAYPYAAVNASAKAAVEECGYRSGRGVGGVGCGGVCPTAESIPPAEPYSTRTLPDIEVDTKVSDMKRWVTDAEANGGGWVQFVFHNICDGCKPSAIKESDFAALVDWLAPRASRGTAVRTVEQVLNRPMSLSAGGPRASRGAT